MAGSLCWNSGYLLLACKLGVLPTLVCAGQKPSRNVWIGCMVALAGCLCIATDASAVDADDAAAFSLGEQRHACAKGWMA